MKIIQEFKNKGKLYYLIQTKYGNCRFQKSDYKKGHKPTINSAVDKNLYFSNLAREIHGNLYDYSLVEYKGYDVKVKIICPIHGVFNQTPHNHITNRNNCTKCGRIQSSNSRITFTKGVGKAIVYCLEIQESDGSIFYKIGFTKHSIKYRYTSFYQSKMPYTNYKVLWEKIYDEDIASIVENKYHKALGKYHYLPKLDFAGSKTECFKIIK